MKRVRFGMMVRRLVFGATLGGVVLGGGCKASEVALDGVYDGLSSSISGVITGIVFEFFDID